jgi:o-succinylbenzoate---CoA ligase
MYQTEISKQTITIEGEKFTTDDILKNKFTPSNSQQNELKKFLLDWFNKNEEMTIMTSGSTGKPKPMNVKKKYMIKSACNTCTYFNLTKNDKVLLCLSLNYIAGKMMVVRALVAGLDIYPVEPTGHPFSFSDQNFKFASLVPLQVSDSIQISTELEQMKNTEILLIGGGPLNPELENSLKGFTNKVYVSYGMAETLSHIAIRRVNGPEASLYYTPLPAISISVSNENKLIVYAPEINKNKIITNDVAEVNADGSFRVFGRSDNVINSGGIKVQAEVIEETLSTYLKIPFAISSVPDIKFGEIIVLVVEQKIDKLLIKKILPHYQIPKRIIQVNKIPLTESGKINRAALKEIIQSM